MSTMSHVKSLRELADMEDTLSHKHGQSYTTEVNQYWKDHYKAKYNEKDSVKNGGGGGQRSMSSFR